MADLIYCGANTEPFAEYWRTIRLVRARCRVPIAARLRGQRWACTHARSRLD